MEGRSYVHELHAKLAACALRVVAKQGYRLGKVDDIEGGLHPERLPRGQVPY